MDADGATRDPDLVEADLARLGSPAPRLAAMLDASVDPGELRRNIVRAEAYVARYLHQRLADIGELMFEELVEYSRVASYIVRRENGKPAEGEVDPDQEWK